MKLQNALFILMILVTFGNISKASEFLSDCDIERSDYTEIRISSLLNDQLPNIGSRVKTTGYIRFASGDFNIGYSALIFESKDDFIELIDEETFRKIEHKLTPFLRESILEGPIDFKPEKAIWIEVSLDLAKKIRSKGLAQKLKLKKVTIYGRIDTFPVGRKFCINLDAIEWSDGNKTDSPQKK